MYVKPGPDRDALAALLRQQGYAPVWLEPALLDPYYNGFCSGVLWQLFHYVPLNPDGWQRMNEHHAAQMQWKVRGRGCSLRRECRRAAARQRGASQVVWRFAQPTHHASCVCPTRVPGTHHYSAVLCSAAPAPPPSSPHALPLLSRAPQAYQTANARFGEAVLGHYQAGDMVWVQDYHLMLLPELLKQAHPKMKARAGVNPSVCSL